MTKSLGVMPVYFLKAVLNTDLELKPEAYITSKMVFFFPAGSESGHPVRRAPIGEQYIAAAMEMAQS